MAEQKSQPALLHKDQREGRRCLAVDSLADSFAL